MQQYHQSQNYSSQLSDIAQEIYKEFICYRYKNEGELRKLHLVIDQLELPMPDNQPISISIYQSQQKLYEHEFRNVDLGQLHHEVELKLTKLDELHLICTVKHRSYYCLIDPKEIPSNYYFHSAVSLVNLEAAPLKPSFVFLQTYIKDSCEVETL